MADYICRTRTSYFSVTDEQAFREAIAKCYAFDEIRIFESTNASGEKQFAFGCHGGLQGFPIGKDSLAEGADDDDEYYCEEYDLGAFHAALQQVLAEGQAIIITEVGCEKMRYLVGVANIITRDSTADIDLGKCALAIARELLNDPQYTPRMEY